MMYRSRAVIGWICTALVCGLLLLSTYSKFTAAPDSETAAIFRQLGIWDLRMLFGALEILSITLFLIPRTSTVGFIFVVSYVAGALATVLTHDQLSQAIPLLIALGLLAIAGYCRIPELSSRLMERRLPPI